MLPCTLQQHKNVVRSHHPNRYCASISIVQATIFSRRVVNELFLEFIGIVFSTYYLLKFKFTHHFSFINTTMKNNMSICPDSGRFIFNFRPNCSYLFLGLMAAFEKASLANVVASNPLPITLICDNIRYLISFQ